MSPDEVQSWLILVTSAVGGLATAGTLAYSRLVKAHLEAEAMAAIHKANHLAITEGRPVPYPEFLPPSGLHPALPAEKG